jgi:hypothetical protein
MAIKVNGTTVIDDSRNLSNVGGLKTINGTSIVGSGNISAGASTTYGAVGTYVHGFVTNNGVAQNSTYAGSGIQPSAWMYYSTGLANDSAGANFFLVKGGSTLSGTWRAMGRANAFTGSSYMRQVLFVRIS